MPSPILSLKLGQNDNPGSDPHVPHNSQERLVARRVVIPDATLAKYLEWVSASCNLTKLVKLYLPKLFWTEATQSFFNDNL